MRSVIVGSLLMCAGCDKLFSLQPVVDAGAAPMDTGSDDARDDGAGAPTDASPDAFADCPSSYTVERSGHRYRYATTAMNWPAARAACEADQLAGSARFTHLVVIDGNSERSFVHTSVMAMSSSSVWIGLTDLQVNGTYQWITSEPINGYPAGTIGWAAEQPNAPADNDCVRMVPPPPQNLGFDDDDCSASFHFVCECDEFSVSID